MTLECETVDTLDKMPPNLEIRHTECIWKLKFFIRDINEREWKESGNLLHFQIWWKVGINSNSFHAKAQALYKNIYRIINKSGKYFCKGLSAGVFPCLFSLQC